MPDRKDQGIEALKPGAVSRAHSGLAACRPVQKPPGLIPPHKAGLRSQLKMPHRCPTDAPRAPCAAVFRRPPAGRFRPPAGPGPGPEPRPVRRPWPIEKKRPSGDCRRPILAHNIGMKFRARARPRGLGFSALRIWAEVGTPPAALVCLSALA